VAFVLSYGQIGPKGNFTHFAHFRDEDLGIAWDFTPLNSVVVEEEVDGCAGKARFVLEGRGVEEEGEGGSGRGGMMRGWGGEEEGGREGGGARKRRRLVLELSKPAGSAACLMGPTGEGFERLCEESFQGEARLVASVLKKGGREGGTEVVMREVVVKRVAFELGGTMRCNGKCENEEAKKEGWAREEGGGGGGVAEEKV
jgi:hypothetical protein